MVILLLQFFVSTWTPEVTMNYSSVEPHHSLIKTVDTCTDKLSEKRNKDRKRKNRKRKNSKGTEYLKKKYIPIIKHLQGDSLREIENLTFLA